MTVPRRTFLKLAAAGTLASALPATAAPVAVTGGPAFGSYWRLVTARPPSPAVHGAIAAVIAETDALMSPYLDRSELTALNRADSTDWLPLSPETATVLAAARAVAQRTGGAFDPTLGPLTARYGFGPIAGRPGGGFAALDLRPGALRKHAPGVTLDLCGIAKGRALDRIAAALDALGTGAFLLELGGEVIARGRHPDDRPWRVAIDLPDPATGPQLALQLDDRAVATSADAPQGYAVGGRRYGHIIDPRSDRPATGTLASVTVLAATGMEADALATALMALGTEDAARLAEAEALDTLLLVRDGATLKPIATGGAARALVS